MSVNQTKEEKARQKQEEELNKKFSLNFTKRELLILHNLILKEPDGQMRRYTWGDWNHIIPILDKIEPIVAVDTNIKESDGRAN